MTVKTRSAGHCIPWVAVALAGLFLQGCSDEKPAPAASSVRLFAADVTGAAKLCSAPKPVLKDGEMAEMAMKVGNDGGWCAIPVTQANGKPFDAGLLIVRPAHGKVFVHQVGGATRIDYTPDVAYAGADAFTVKLIPGNPGIRATVTVTRP